MLLSIIIPSLNEAADIGATLAALQPLRERGHEVIVADGGSTDGTPVMAAPFSDAVVRAPKGRARQFNAGAQTARGDVLLFLQADSRVPPNAEVLIAAGLRCSQRSWGRFDIRFTGHHRLLRAVETMKNWHSRWTEIATAEQAIFVRRSLFIEVGGFPDIELVDDVALSRKLRQAGPPLCLSAKVVTSSRPWEHNGILRTALLMWRLRAGYLHAPRTAALDAPSAR